MIYRKVDDCASPKMASAMTAEPQSLYEQIGTTPGVRRLVDRFYTLMDSEPLYAELRAMHEADLDPMRASLTAFLTAWLGGPRDWFVMRPGVCVMSPHRAMGVTRETAVQWVHAMSRAMAETGVEPGLGQRMQQSFARMASAMIAQQD